MKRRGKKRWIEIIKDWKKQPVYPVPTKVKRVLLYHYAKKYNFSTLIETGTYNGGTVNALKGYFSKIYSIELNKNLYEKATAKFKNQHNIEIIQGK
jgi:hypothetical protein